MSDYLSETTLSAVFPSSLSANGRSYSLENTESLNTGTDLAFQWGLYTSGDYWIVRICKPDNAASPSLYYYDDLADTDGTTMDQKEWLLASIVFSSTLWNS